MPTPIVSLCMPTNGVSHWVFNSLKSIEDQHISPELYEVVITDNGHNQEFKTQIREYVKEHPNVVYAETDALPFINEIEAYKRASGILLKFINHRTLLLEGTLQFLIDTAKKFADEKPILYFADGSLKELSKEKHEYKSFDEFVKNLSIYSSWSMGMTIWKDDFEKIHKDLSKYNKLFPHTEILFNERSRGKYIIDNSDIFGTQPQGKTPKGDYDLWYAFGVDYPAIILQLYRDGDITANTFKAVSHDIRDYLAELYWHLNVKKMYSSYDLSGLKDMYGVFYKKSEILFRVLLLGLTAIPRRINRMVSK